MATYLSVPDTEDITQEWSYCDRQRAYTNTSIAWGAGVTHQQVSGRAPNNWGGTQGRDYTALALSAKRLCRIILYVS